MLCLISFLVEVTVYPSYPSACLSVLVTLGFFLPKYSVPAPVSVFSVITLLVKQCISRKCLFWSCLSLPLPPASLHSV